MTTRSQMREFGPCLNSISWLASCTRAAALPGKSLAGTHGLHSVCEMLSEIARRRLHRSGIGRRIKWLLSEASTD